MGRLFNRSPAILRLLAEIAERLLTLTITKIKKIEGPIRKVGGYRVIGVLDDGSEYTFILSQEAMDKLAIANAALDSDPKALIPPAKSTSGR